MNWKSCSGPNAVLEGAVPIGLEAAWGKDRTQDKRPTIGIKSDIVHPLGIVMEPLGQGEIELLDGTASRGFLSHGTPDVIYGLSTTWRTEKGLPFS